jgi:branched-chain amino acid transport system permease protein
MALAFPLQLKQTSSTYLGLRLLRVALVAVVLLALPYLVPSFRLGQITAALILATAAVGQNVLSGYGGLISLGQAAFFGLGAYTTAILVQKEGMPVPLAFVVGIVLCFLVGVVVGLPALRLRGTYLALVTLAIGVVFPSVVRRFSDLTGGSIGLFGLSYSPPSGIAYFSGRGGEGLWMYWVATIALLLSCLVVWNIMRSRMGRAIVALRDNEAAAVVMGVNRTLVRTVLFGISAGIAGLAGGVYAVNTGLINPDSFSLLFTIYLLVAMVLGGSGSYWGPILGGFAIYFVPVWSSDIANGPIAGVIFGVIILLMVFGMRSGLVGGIKRLASFLVVIVPQPPKVSAGLADRALLSEVEVDEHTGHAVAAPAELTTHMAGAAPPAGTSPPSATKA